MRMKSSGDAAEDEAARSQQDPPGARPGRSGEGAGSALEHLLRQERTRGVEPLSGERHPQDGANP